MELTLKGVAGKGVWGKPGGGGGRGRGKEELGSNALVREGTYTNQTDCCYA